MIFFLALVCLVAPAVAAPLGETRDRQASDAVRLLQEYGLVEGYPDGTFRGERAVTRYEAAMLLARALARLEQEHATLARKNELAELRTLALSFKDELTALGVRVDHLEEQTDRLDKRVQELSRISFDGKFVTRVLTQWFHNTGNLRSGTGPGTLGYSTLVGTAAGANLRPHGPPGVLPVIDLVRGRPLTNGTGFSSALLLNTNIQPNEDLNILMRLWAYTSQGDSEVDAVWGVTPPYLANSFTGRPFTGGAVDGTAQGLRHFPFTSAGIDKLEVTYVPEQLTLTAGAFRPRIISPLVYQGEVNPAVGDPRVLESFGFHVTGDNEPLRWEVFGTRLPDGNPGVGSQYQSDALGAALEYHQDEWTVALNFLRAANQKPSDSPLTVGQIFTFVQGRTGEFYTDWVNPPGFFVNQLGGAGSPNVAGVGSTTDIRPVNGLVNFDGLNTQATFGPQGISMGGLSLTYEEEDWSAFADYDHSVYKPSKNSAFSRAGDMFRVGAQTSFDEGRWEVGLEYRHTDPTYDPFMLSFPGTAAGQRIFRVYHRLPDFDQFWHLWSLHNTDEFPHNRRGLWARVRWQYDPDGSLSIRYRALSQVQTSLQDVRVLPGSLGPGTPQTLVLGHAPGFFDPVFREYSPLSFDGALNPRENQRGRVHGLQVEFNHLFTDTPWRVEAGYERFSFQRPSVLSAAFGGSQNRVDLVASNLKLGVGHSFGDDVLLRVGYEQGAVVGHYDPFGNYNPFAIATGLTSFRNWDSIQHVPNLGVDWQVSEGVKASALYRYYINDDRANPAIFSGPPGGFGSSVHPFSYAGGQIQTTLEVSF